MASRHAPGSSMASTAPLCSRGADRAGARSSPSCRTMRWWWASPPVRVSAAAGGRAAELAPGPLHSPHHRPRRSQHDSLSPTEDATLDWRWCHPRRSSTVGVNWRRDAALSPSARPNRQATARFSSPPGTSTLRFSSTAGHGTTHPSSCSSKKPAADSPIYGAVAGSTRGLLSTPTGSCTTSFGPSSHHWRRPLLPTSPAVSDPAFCRPRRRSG